MGWHYHVPRHRRADDERADFTSAFHDEDKGRSSTRAQVFRLDRWVHLVLAALSSRCGSPRGSMTSQAPPSCTGSASKGFFFSELVGAIFELKAPDMLDGDGR